MSRKHQALNSTPISTKKEKLFGLKGFKKGDLGSR
jgi:hypothetical protein